MRMSFSHNVGWSVDGKAFVVSTAATYTVSPLFYTAWDEEIIIGSISLTEAVLVCDLYPKLQLGPVFPKEWSSISSIPGMYRALTVLLLADVLGAENVLHLNFVPHIKSMCGHHLVDPPPSYRNEFQPGGTAAVQTRRSTGLTAIHDSSQ
jgi:hypothetical protein